MKRLLAVMIFVVGCGGTMDAPNDGPPASTEVTSMALKALPRNASRPGLKATPDSAMLASTSDWAGTYSILNTSAIYFAFDLSAPAGHHSERLYLYEPNGSLYQEIDVAFAVAETAGANEQRAEALGNGLYRVWANLPVAGTDIVNGSIVGTWSAKGFVDASGAPSSQLSFFLHSSFPRPGTTGTPLHRAR